jgi:poly-beta-1,6-N-acetyl-D-glucosamine synthase
LILVIDIARIVFWVCVLVVAYSYFGYPILIRVLARLRPRPVRKASIEPSVAFIIAAFNEEKVIAEKLENTLALLWPRDKLDIIVIADGSTDATVRIAESYRDRGVRVLYRPARQGKTQALNRATAETNSEILFFSDANTSYRPHAIRLMVRNFADPEVGGVSGRKIVLADNNREASKGETAYWDYESRLKQAESAVGSIVTADGEIFALRRCLFQPIPRPIVHDDMYLTMQLVAAGYRVVYEPEATSAEFASHTLKDEFHLKVRYASAGFQIVSCFKKLLLNPGCWFAWQFFSHKLTRWLIPVFILGVFVSSAILNDLFYRTAFWAQILFYLLAVIGSALPRTRTGLIYFPWYFSVMNTAALYGCARYLTIGQSPHWRKAQR